ncbi:MAG TPA: adenylate/guanylate cyclase domain-containing protein [Caldimonas sp.]|jgi:pimeloyl-ACP methyl ester carboxylesterase
MVPQTNYARSGDINIAYQVFGAGAVDLVVVPGWISSIDVYWEDPGFTRFLQRLGSFARVILFDKRGTGLSDRVTDTPTLEERMDDVRAVMDAVGSRRAALLGYSEGGPMCILFAVTYPERTEALVTVGSFARIAWGPDYPFGRTREQQDAWLREISEHWGEPVGVEARAPSLAKDERFRAWWSKLLRAGGSPTTAVALTRMNYDIDVRHVLPVVRVPTLLLHPSRDKTASVECSRYMVARIPGAKLIELDSDDHLSFLVRPAEIPGLVQEFLTGGRGVVEDDRVVKTVMFSDIVSSTELATKLGDARWRDLRDAHHAAVRRELAIYRGEEVDTAGDGFYAAFDGPARAIRCACEVRKSLQSLGLTSRLGLHTGECIVGGEKISGLAVHIGARVAGLAPAGKVLVSQTVKDLVAGSGLEFEDFGVHALKGVPDSWHLYSVKEDARA